MDLHKAMNGREAVTCMQCKYFGCCNAGYRYNSAFCVTKRDFFYNGVTLPRITASR